MKTIFKLAFMAAIVFNFSCSPEAELSSEDLQVANARSKVKNDMKSKNAKLKTLVKGSILKGSNGLDVGPDGNLYVASVNGQEIVVMNKNNGKIINRFGPANGVLGPDDMIFGPDNTFYWTDLITGFVGRATTDGQLLGYQEVAPGVNPIRFSEDGRLFVALDFLGDGLYELDPNLVEEPKQLIACPTGFCIGFFNSFDTRWEGDRLILYGPLFAANLIVAIDVTDITETKSFNTIEEFFADPSTRIVAGFDGSLNNPAAAKFGPDGMLYVLDQTGKLFKVNADGFDDKTLFTTLPPGLDNMTFDDDGSLYMTNADEGWVAEILPSGQPRYISPGGMILPQGLAVLPGSNNQDALFEADLFRLRKFNGTSGRQEELYKGFLINPTLELPILPMNIKAAGDKLLVTSWFSAGVQLWDVGTNPATVLETYAMPVPIDAVQINGEIIVSDFGLGGVVYASNFTRIKPLGAASGLATDGEILWAADQASGEIWQIEFDGGSTTETLVASGLAGPEGLALDNQGRLLVVEATASRLSRIDLSTGDITVIVDGLEFYGPGLGVPATWGFEGIAVGQKGDIYISGTLKNIIHKIPGNKAR